MVDPIIGMKRLTKVRMDGGSGLNIMDAETLDAMGIDQSRIRPTGVPFHGIGPRKQAMPLDQSVRHLRESNQLLDGDPYL